MRVTSLLVFLMLGPGGASMGAQGNGGTSVVGGNHPSAPQADTRHPLTQNPVDQRGAAQTNTSARVDTSAAAPREALSVPRTAVNVVLITTLVALIILSGFTAWRDGAFVESNWGGFGGGLGGWRVSPSFIYFFAAIAFGAMLTYLAGHDHDTREANANGASVTQAGNAAHPDSTKRQSSPPVAE